MLPELECFRQALEETDHVCRWRQKEVAKIVQCGEPRTLTKSKQEAADDGGLTRLCRFLCLTA